MSIHHGSLKEGRAGHQQEAEKALASNEFDISLFVSLVSRSASRCG
jgi:hypothetical protein